MSDKQLADLLGRPINKAKQPAEFEETADEYTAVGTVSPVATKPATTKKAKPKKNATIWEEEQGHSADFDGDGGPSPAPPPKPNITTLSF